MDAVNPEFALTCLEARIKHLNEENAKLLLQIDELTKKGLALCGQNGEILLAINRLLSLHARDCATDGDHAEFCDCEWCKAWGVAREVTGRSEKRKDDTCPACNGRGFLQFLAGGEETTCALCDGNKKV